MVHFIIPPDEIDHAEQVVRYAAGQHFGHTGNDALVEIHNNRIGILGNRVALIAGIRSGLMDAGYNIVPLTDNKK